MCVFILIICLQVIDSNFFFLRCFLHQQCIHIGRRDTPVFNIPMLKIDVRKLHSYVRSKYLTLIGSCDVTCVYGILWYACTRFLSKHNYIDTTNKKTKVCSLFWHSVYVSFVLHTRSFVFTFKELHRALLEALWIGNPNYTFPVNHGNLLSYMCII